MCSYNKLYIVTFNSSYEYIKTFISDKPPTEIYENHKIIYDGLYDIDQIKQTTYDINVYYVGPTDIELLTKTLQCLNTMNTCSGYYKYSKDITLLAKLFKQCQKTNELLSQINNSDDDSINEYQYQLYKYNPTGKPINVLNPDSTTDSNDELIDDIMMEKNMKNDVDYNLPLAFDISWSKNNSNKFRIDIEKRIPEDIESYKVDLDTNNKPVNEPNTNTIETSDINIIKKDIELKNINLNDDTKDNIKTDFVMLDEYVEDNSKSPKYNEVLDSNLTKFYDNSPIIDDKLYKKISNSTHNPLNVYEDMINERNKPIGKLEKSNINIDGFDGSFPNRKRAFINIKQYKIIKDTKNSEINSLAIVINNIPNKRLTIIGGEKAIKILNTSTYFPEFSSIKEFVTPETEEYYQCVVIKMHQLIKEKKINHTFDSNKMTGTIQSNIVEKMYEILNSVNNFLNYPDYNEYLHTKLANKDASMYDKLLVKVDSFIKERTIKVPNIYNCKNDNIKYDDFLKEFNNYLIEIKSPIQSVSRRDADLIEQYLVFYHNCEIKLDMNLNRIINLRINKKITPNTNSMTEETLCPLSSLIHKTEKYDLATIDKTFKNNNNSHIGINSIGQTLRNTNHQLRIEPQNPQTYISPWNQTTIEPISIFGPM